MSVVILIWCPWKDIASCPSDFIVIATRPEDTCSPLEVITSNSLSSGGSITSFARPTSLSVSPAMAETTAITSVFLLFRRYYVLGYAPYFLDASNACSAVFLNDKSHFPLPATFIVLDSSSPWGGNWISIITAFPGNTSRTLSAHSTTETPSP